MTQVKSYQNFVKIKSAFIQAPQNKQARGKF